MIQMKYTEAGDWMFPSSYYRLKPKKPIVYVAHPVGNLPYGNAWSAAKWIHALTKLDPSRIYVAHWVAEVLAFPDSSGRYHRSYEESLADDEFNLVALKQAASTGRLDAVKGADCRYLPSREALQAYRESKCKREPMSE